MFLLALVSPTIGLSQEVDRYIRALTDQQATIRMDALQSKEIVSCFASHDDGDTCRLDKEDYRRLTEVFLRLLTDPEPKIRVKAVYYLKSTTDSRFTRPIAQLLKDPSPQVRAAAADSFGETVLKDDEIVRDIEHLLGDKDKNVRRSAASALGLSGTRRSLDLLREAYKREADQDNKVLMADMVKELENRVGKRERKN